jgi:hypothetical protein
MNVNQPTRLTGYIIGYLLAGVWASVAPYLAHRGVDSYTIALISGLVALVSAGLHALAAGHISLPSSSSADVVSGSVVSDGSDLSVTVLDPTATDAPVPAPAVPGTAATVVAPVADLAPGTPITPQIGA